MPLHISLNLQTFYVYLYDFHLQYKRDLGVSSKFLDHRTTNVLDRNKSGTAFDYVEQ